MRVVIRWYSTHKLICRIWPSSGPVHVSRGICHCAPPLGVNYLISEITEGLAAAAAGPRTAPLRAGGSVAGEL